MTEHHQKMAKVLAKAWMDPAAMQRLKDDPKAVLSEAGIAVKGRVHVHHESDGDTHIVIPKRPAGMSDDDLKAGKVHPDLCCVCLV